jgi:cardiolipin synthase
MASRSLLVFPDDSATAIVSAIERARNSIRIKMFVFSDPALLEAVIAARKRGINVRVMLNPARRNGEEDNVETRAALERAGIDVTDSNPEFRLTHEKSMVIDSEFAMIKSLNWETDNLTKTRDYAIVTDHAKEVAEVAECFDADWNRVPFDCGTDAKLVWCPGNGRERICHFIDEAAETLFIQNERYQDTVVIERIVRAAGRGVKVHVMARAAHTLKMDKLVEGVGGLRILDDVGVKVHKLNNLTLHGKMLLADGERAIVGSINLAPGSLDGRRELAIEADDKNVIERLLEISKHDWKESSSVDLTDEGLRKDLEDRQGAAEVLVLDAED